MLQELNTYDWEEVFCYASPRCCEAGHDHIGPTSTIDCNVATTPFTREDVEQIIAMEEGENDGDYWLGVFKLQDGRFACVRAGCDYTGWD